MMGTGAAAVRAGASIDRGRSTRAARCGAQFSGLGSGASGQQEQMRTPSRIQRDGVRGAGV